MASRWTSALPTLLSSPRSRSILTVARSSGMRNSFPSLGPYSTLPAFLPRPTLAILFARAGLRTSLMVSAVPISFACRAGGFRTLFGYTSVTALCSGRRKSRRPLATFSTEHKGSDGLSLLAGAWSRVLLLSRLSLGGFAPGRLGALFSLGGVLVLLFHPFLSLVPHGRMRSSFSLQGKHDEASRGGFPPRARLHCKDDVWRFTFL